MPKTSTPGIGPSFDDRIRERERKSAAIREEERRLSLERLRRQETDFAGELSAARQSISDDTAAWRSRHRDLLLRMEADMKRMRGRVRRWNLWRVLPGMLGGIALCLMIQGSALWLIRPQLQELALNRMGLTVVAGADGRRWISIPEGTLITRDYADNQLHRTTARHYYLISED